MPEQKKAYIGGITFTDGFISAIRLRLNPLLTPNTAHVAGQDLLP